MEEIWKDVLGYEGSYQVSSLGRVKSLDREVKHLEGTRLKYGKIHDVKANIHGYKRFSTWSNDSFKTQNIHRMVWEAFNNIIPDGMVINHIDGNKSNNKLTNLEVCTPKQNTHHMIFTLGKNNIGENHSMAILTENQAKEIIQLRKEGLIAREISEKMGLRYLLVKSCYTGNSWKHLPR